MSVELLNTLSLVAFIAAGVFFFIAALLFFVLRVPRLFGEISGETARKEISAIRRQSENSDAGISRDILKKHKRSVSAAGSGGHTDKFSTDELLEGAKRMVLLNGADETQILWQGESGETSVLAEQDREAFTREDAKEHSDFTVVFEIGFLGSEELIE